MTEEREVAITGLGAVTSFGRDVTTFWEALVAGRSAIAPITAFDASAYPCSIAG
ncbi:MAG: beta-ketoacyl-[acyl-carrier-protein] synthase II, partial [Chloroflexi bacterium]|nr:beta-ketoacyl-[acyl-carrier-protein] synthase II [Chloroflexota bacterium]